MTLYRFFFVKMEGCSGTNALGFSLFKTNRSRSSRRASSMVEFGLVLPALVMLVMGMIQYGIVLNARLSLYHVSRAAGRYAAVNATAPNIDSTIKATTVSMAQGYGLTLLPANITLSPAENPTSTSTNRVKWGTLTMTITYDMSKKVFLPQKVFGATMPYATSVTTTSTMIME